MARRGGDGVGAVVGRERRPKAGACFYENINYGGRYFCVRPAEVRVFTDHDYHGRSGEVRRDVGDLHGMWRDSIESIRVG